MRHFTAVGKNRLANSSVLSFDLDSAILCYLGPGHLTSLSVVFLSSIARVPCPAIYHYSRVLELF